jgi:hypothetical protein
MKTVFQLPELSMQKASWDLNPEHENIVQIIQSYHILIHKQPSSQMSYWKLLF